MGRSCHFIVCNVEEELCGPSVFAGRCIGQESFRVGLNHFVVFDRSVTPHLACVMKEVWGAGGGGPNNQSHESTSDDGKSTICAMQNTYTRVPKWFTFFECGE